MKSEQRIKTENLGQEGLSISQIKSALAVKSEPCLAVKSAPGLGVKSEPGSTVKTEPGSASMSMSSDSKGQDGPASQPSSSVKPDLGLSDSGALKATAHDTGKGKAKEEEDDDLWAQVGDLEPPKQMWLDPELSREQESVRRMVIDEGKSLFFTGGAGE